MSKVFEHLSFDASKEIKEDVFERQQELTPREPEPREPETFEGKVSKSKKKSTIDGPKYPNMGNRGSSTSYGFDEHEQYVSDDPEFE